jgi:anti-sigma factor RsiW
MNMNAISDNDLILYFYQDGLDTGRIAEIDAALRASDALRARYAELQRTLHAVDADSAIEADAGFTQRVWRRLEQRIEAASPSPVHNDWRTRLRDLLQSLLSPRFALAATCLLALAIGIGYYAGRSSASHESNVRESAMAARVLDAYVAEHLRATEGLLLTAANSDSNDLHASNSDVAATLVESNRLYAAAAARAGNTRLADFLRQLEPVLIDLANQPADASIQSRDGLRDYLRKTDLLFQVRATQARIDSAGKHKT